MLALGIASDRSVLERNFSIQGHQFSGDAIYDPIGQPDKVMYADWQKYIKKESGDASSLLEPSYRVVSVDVLIKNYRDRIKAIMQPPVDDANLILIGKFNDSINKVNDTKEKDQHRARTILSVAEITPVIALNPSDSVQRLFSVLDLFEEKYSASIADRHKLIVHNIQQTGRAETTDQLVKALTSFKYHLSKETELLYCENPELSLQQQGQQDNEQAANDHNDELNNYINEFRMLPIPDRPKLRTPKLVFPYPVTSAISLLAVHNYKVKLFCAKVQNNRQPRVPVIDITQDTDYLPERDIPDICLVDPLVQPLSNHDILGLLRDRMESGPLAPIASYRKMVLTAIRNKTAFGDLEEQISLALADDIPSVNHLLPGLHAAHARLHGTSNATSSAHSAYASEVINDLLDHGAASTNMAIGSGSQLAELNNRVRQLEQSHEDTKRQRVQF